MPTECMFVSTFEVFAYLPCHCKFFEASCQNSAFEMVGVYAHNNTHCVQKRCRTWRHTPVPSQEKMDIWVRAAEDEYEALDAQRETWQMMVFSWLKVI